MAAVDPGEVFIEDLLLPLAEQQEITENLDVPDTDDFDDDASQFTTDTVEDITGEDVFGNVVPTQGDENKKEDPSNHDENRPNTQNLRAEIDTAQPISESPIPDDLPILLGRHVSKPIPTIIKSIRSSHSEESFHCSLPI